MTIRPWRFEDILALSELEKQCFSTDLWSYRVFASCYENAAFSGFVATEDDEIVGFGGITVAVDTADIENVFVSEQYRRGGTGTKLIEELKKCAAEKGAEKIFLEVRVSNAPAMAMYLKCGFKGCYARTRYYSDGEDCLVMKYSLK